jgi:hypothetical protein
VTDRRRFLRQMLVTDIGERGQARLERATAAVAGEGLRHEIAAAYASRAGMGRVVAGAIDEERLAPGFLENAAARAVVAGSRAALSSLRAALSSDDGAIDAGGPQAAPSNSDAGGPQAAPSNSDAGGPQAAPSNSPR